MEPGGSGVLGAVFERAEAVAVGVLEAEAAGGPVVLGRAQLVDGLAESGESLVQGGEVGGLEVEDAVRDARVAGGEGESGGLVLGLDEEEADAHAHTPRLALAVIRRRGRDEHGVVVVRPFAHVAEGGLVPAGRAGEGADGDFDGGEGGVCHGVLWWGICLWVFGKVDGRITEWYGLLITCGNNLLSDK